MKNLRADVTQASSSSDWDMLCWENTEIFTIKASFNERTGIEETVTVCLLLFYMIAFTVFFLFFRCIAGIPSDITLKSKFILLLQPLRGIETVVFGGLCPILCFTMDLY